MLTRRSGSQAVPSSAEPGTLLQSATWDVTFGSQEDEADEQPLAAGSTASFQAWLQQHGNNLCRLIVDGPPTASMQSVCSTIRSLPQLQDLCLSGLAGMQGAAVVQLPADLPTSLTQLALANYDSHDGARIPLVSLDLPRLEVLQLTGVCFDPRILRGLTQLQHLFLNVFHTDAQAGVLSGDGAAAGAAIDPLETLLEGMQSLKQLTKLWFEFKWEVDAPPIPSHAWAALTASSQLRSLYVTLTFCDVEALPGSGVLHMFPGQERQLPQLTRLQLGCSTGCWRHNWCVPARDLRRVAASCPHLKDFDFHRLLDRATVQDLTPLLTLTSCTRLALGGDGIDSAVAPIVAELTQLQSLTWSCAEDGELDANALAQLTALTQLRQLECTARDFDCMFAEDFDPDIMDGLAMEQLGLPDIKNRPYWELLSLSSYKEEGPVWLQILKLLKVPDSVLELVQQCHQQGLQLPAFNYQAYQQLRSNSERLQSLRGQAAGLEGQALPPSAEAALQPAGQAGAGPPGGSNPDSPAATGSEALQVLLGEVAELEGRVAQDSACAFSHAPQAALAGVADALRRQPQVAPEVPNAEMS